MCISIKGKYFINENIGICFPFLLVNENCLPIHSGYKCTKYQSKCVRFTMLIPNVQFKYVEVYLSHFSLISIKALGKNLLFSHLPISRNATLSIIGFCFWKIAFYTFFLIAMVVVILVSSI